MTTPPTRSPVLLLLLVLLLTACTGTAAQDISADSSPTTADDADAAPDEDDDAADPVTLRLGYFPNVTHAPAIVGVEEGILAEALGDRVTLETTTFNAGGEAVTALFSDALDITYIGPGPAINAWSQSDGEAVRLIAGSTSGGAALIVRDGIDGPEDLAGATLATPALGNTQDIALRAWLAEEGFETTLEGGGDVQIIPQANSEIFETFRAGQIDGAWVPAPWATRLVNEAEGVVLLDERDIWPDGEFVTTHVLVATAFLEAHPDIVADFLRGHIAAIDVITEDPAAAQTVTNDGIEALVDQRLADATIEGAWETLTFTLDPIAGSLAKGAQDAIDADLLEPVELEGIYALDPLNEILTELGRDTVDDGGLGG